MKYSDLYPVSVIGLGCADLSQPSVWLPYRNLLAESDIICGGKSQLAALAKALPELAPQESGEPCHCNESNTPQAAKLPTDSGSQQQPPHATAQKSRRFLPIGAGFDALLDELCRLREQGEKIVVLASGDPLFYGVGASLAARFGEEGEKVRSGLVIYPAVSSMQEACSRLALPWDDAIFVSLHGRDENIHTLYNAVHGARCARPVCVLLDHKRSPAQLAAALLERGITAYTMHFFAGLESRHTALKSPSATGCECENGAALYVSAPLTEAPQTMPANAPAPGLLILEPHRRA
ncbi:precorrin-6y C5,15-methyltransferase (decarboxylating) subunit CbiE, partial [Desulfovibrio sp. OttesenSCG-928-C06]|nr:precorrin-6y C5,15-methyltransferase (decarboxylating) subunit CbiE [Desulfovibrio sp. OttesenSCG-928-C06]